MQAYVLAAGVGSRLRPLTTHLPKPMVPFMNRPLISYLLNHLHPHVNHTRVNVAFNKDPLIEFLNYQKGTSYFDEGIKPAGSALTLSLEKQYCAADTTLVVCGDLLCNWNIAQMMRFHQEKKALVTIAVRPMPDPRRYGVVVTDQHHRITEFYEKPQIPPSNFISCGIYLFSPRVFDYWQVGWKDIGQDVFPALVSEGLPVYAWPLDPMAFWSDLGTPLDYLQAHLTLARGMNTIHHSAEVSQQAGLQETAVGAGATINHKAFLERCVVWPGVAVDAYTQLQDAIITPHELVSLTM